MVSEPEIWIFPSSKSILHGFSFPFSLFSFSFFSSLLLLGCYDIGLFDSSICIMLEGLWRWHGGPSYLSQPLFVLWCWNSRTDLMASGFVDYLTWKVYSGHWFWLVGIFCGNSRMNLGVLRQLMAFSDISGISPVVSSCVSVIRVDLRCYTVVLGTITAILCDFWLCRHYSVVIPSHHWRYCSLELEEKTNVLLQLSHIPSLG